MYELIGRLRKAHEVYRADMREAYFSQKGWELLRQRDHLVGGDSLPSIYSEAADTIARLEEENKKWMRDMASDCIEWKNACSRAEAERDEWMERAETWKRRWEKLNAEVFCEKEAPHERRTRK